MCPCDAWRTGNPQHPFSPVIQLHFTYSAFHPPSLVGYYQMRKQKIDPSSSPGERTPLKDLICLDHSFTLYQMRNQNIASEASHMEHTPFKNLTNISPGQTLYSKQGGGNWYSRLPAESK